MRAVGRADLDQSGARARHDFRHAKRAANLDELAARHDRLATIRKRVQHEQHGGGIVIDDRRVLRAGQIAEETSDMVVPFAALAGLEIELQRHRILHGRDSGFDRRFGEHCPARDWCAAPCRSG